MVRMKKLRRELALLQELEKLRNQKILKTIKKSITMMFIPFRNLGA